MGQIYATADNILAWLGPATEISAHGMLWLQEYLHPGSIELSVVRKMRLSSKVAECLKDITTRPWWTRMWVVQELLLANRAYLCCGRQRILWPNSGFLGVRERSWSDLPLSFYGLETSAVGHLLRLQQSLVKSRPSLLEIFTIFQHHQCTDPRDRVFSVLNLVEEADAIWNSADYSLSLFQIQKRLVSESIRSHRDLRILSYARGVQSRRTFQSKEPSWAPRWGIHAATRRAAALTTERQETSARSHLKYPTGFGMVSYTIPKWSPFRKFNTSGSNLPVMVVEPALSFRGFEFDEVRECVPMGPHKCPVSVLRSSTRQNQLEFELSSKIAALFRSVSHGYDDENLPNVFARTILADSYHHFYQELRNLHRPRFATATQFSGSQEELDDFTAYEILLRLDNGRKPDVEHITGLLYFYALNRRSFFVTYGGRFGIGPRYLQTGDLACVLFGGEAPFILRRTTDQNGSKFLLVGEAYIDGVMDGEMMVELDQSSHEEQTFELV